MRDLRSLSIVAVLAASFACSRTDQRFATAPEAESAEQVATQSAPANLEADDCKNSGWEALGYRNQGQCVSDVQRRPKSGDSVEFLRGHGAAGGTDLTPQLTGIEISGENRLLICAISSGRANADPFSVVSAVALHTGAGGNPQPMTMLGDYYQAPQDGARWSTWYLTGARVGTNRTVTATRTDTPEGWTIVCESYTGVNQSVPFGSVSTASGAGGAATLAVASSSDGSVPWGHLTSSNAPYSAGAGVTDRQIDLNSGTPNGAMVDGNIRLGAGVPHTFSWNYSGEFGGQAAMIRPASQP